MIQHLHSNNKDACLIQDVRESPEAQEVILTHIQDVHSDIMLNEVIICQSFFFSHENEQCG